jgi:hypothetical protein
MQLLIPEDRWERCGNPDQQSKPETATIKDLQETAARSLWKD